MPATWGIADPIKSDKIQVAGEPRGRAATPGFYRLPFRLHGQQVTKAGVPPLPRKNSQQEARFCDTGFLFFLEAVGGFRHTAGEPRRKEV
jgi:hypothetical protein